MTLQMTQPVTQSIGALLHGIVDSNRIPAVLAEKQISDITLDSRLSTAGSLFAAIPGHETDGRKFVRQALERGAEGILFESGNAPDTCNALGEQEKAIAVNALSKQISLIAARLFSHPSQYLKVIGITGTNGKTTCAMLLQQALESLGMPCAMMGTLGAAFKDQVENIGLTTADPVAVQRSLYAFKQGGANAVCMEVSSHGLDQDRVAAVEFNIAVFTNLSQDHLDYHATMTAYGQAKKKLFGFPGLDAIVVNADDALGQEILSSDYSCQAISYGMSNADIVPKNCEFSSRGISFDLALDGKEVRLHAPLFGDINLPNLLATAATLVAVGYSLSEIASTFPGLASPPGRMERFYGGVSAPAVVVDYSHTPDSLQRALDGLSVFTDGKVWVVFGCGGDRDKEKRPLMGRIAEHRADVVIVTNDNPRSEDPAQIVQDIAAGFSGSHNAIHTILDRGDAIAYAIDNAGANDLVLIAGKGHETTQVIGQQVLHFSDREAVTAVLERRA